MAKFRTKEKNVVFASERYSKRQELRKFLIPLAVIAVIALIVLAAALISKSIRSSWTQNQDSSPYAYRWKVDKKGGMSLIIDHSEQPEAAWQFTGTAGDASAEVETAKRQPQNGSRFDLTAASPGRSVVYFDLISEGSAVFNLCVDIEASENEDGVIIPEVLAAGGTVKQGTVQGTPGEYYSYTIGPSEEDGKDLCIIVNFDSGVEVGGWTVTSSDEAAVESVGLIEEAEKVTAYLYPGTQTGDSEVVLSSETAGVTVRCSVTRDESGILILGSHGMEGGDKAPETESSETEPLDFDAMMEEALERFLEENPEAIYDPETGSISFPETEDPAGEVSSGVVIKEEESGE